MLSSLDESNFQMVKSTETESSSNATQTLNIAPRCEPRARSVLSCQTSNLHIVFQHKSNSVTVHPFLPKSE